MPRKKPPIKKPKNPGVLAFKKAAKDGVLIIEKMGEGKEEIPATYDVTKTTNRKPLSVLPSDTPFQAALKEVGCDVAYVAATLHRIMNAKTAKVGKHGDLVYTDNLNIQLKAVEVWMRIFGEDADQKDSGAKHVHLHGSSDKDLSKRLQEINDAGGKNV